MKFGELKSVGHNIADSLAGGCSFLLGFYDLDVFGEALETPEGFICVDFLAGKSSGGRPSTQLGKAISQCPAALEKLCATHGFAASEFRTLNARFGVDRVYGRHFTVTVESRTGRTSSDQYVGLPGRRLTARR